MSAVPAAGVGVVSTRHVRLPLPPEGLRLECGDSLPELDVAYETYGALSAAKDNAIFICHALTGDAHVAGTLDTPDGPRGWWDEMIGPGRGIDTDYYYVVCANILGGCRGTTGPLAVDPRTGRPYGAAFPAISVADIVDVHVRLLRHLGVETAAAVIGGSFGGMQVLDWAIRYPATLRHGVCIATAPSLSSQALAFDVVGRYAITADPDWRNGDYAATDRRPEQGLALARQIGHITYLSSEMMTRKFGRTRMTESTADEPGSGQPGAFAVESYLAYQGRKFVERFDANAYLSITRAMDEFDVARGHASLEAALAPIQAKMLVVGLSEDWLFPPEQTALLAGALLRAGKAVSSCRLHAPHGHDAFLVDIANLGEVLRAFLPWVKAAGVTHTTRRQAQRRREFEIIASMVKPGVRVLDAGCGNGELLSFLRRTRQTTGLGIEIDIDRVIETINAGHDGFHADMDEGLAMIPDGAFDYAILCETLQVVRHPLHVLREVVRVAEHVLVSFPNFANWANRLALGRGRMPRSGALPYAWYETPNIHLFTQTDFLDLCRREGLTVETSICIPENALSRLLIRLRRCNLGADRVLMRLVKGEKGSAGCRSGEL